MPPFSRKGGDSGNLSVTARCVTRPRRTMDSTLTWSPYRASGYHWEPMSRCSRMNRGRAPPRGSFTYARHACAQISSRSSSASTAWVAMLPAPTTGFSTAGSPTVCRASWNSSAVRTSANRGTGTPAARSAARCRVLLRRAGSDSCGLPGRPSSAAAVCASTTGISLNAAMPSAECRFAYSTV